MNVVPTRSSLASRLVPGWLRRGATSLAEDALRRWPLYALVFGIWALATARALWSPMPLIPLLFNSTPSLPYHVAVVDYNRSTPLARGEYVVFAFEGEARRDYPGLAGQPFFKRVAGLPGDVVTVRDRLVFVNGLPIGLAKEHTHDGRPLQPIEPTVIPPGHLFVQGTHPDSFDSRYRSSGLVRMEQVAARVNPIF
jgi:conjugal transfer pilin signal peptidase TrbI